MKKILVQIISIILLINFSLQAQQSNCDRITFFGKTEICLPNIKGYEECYTEPAVKQLADGTEIEMNTVLGFYLNDQTYAKKDSLGLFTFDDYFKIYGTKQLSEYKADEKSLNEMLKVVSGSFLSKNWDVIEKETDKLQLNIEIGAPTIIKEYQLTDNSFTLILLSNYTTGEKTITMAMALNCLLINERLVCMAYYLQYQDAETISLLEAKSNLILTAILNAKK